MSSAGDKSRANEAGDDLVLSADILLEAVLFAVVAVLVVADDGWRDIVKENS